MYLVSKIEDTVRIPPNKFSDPLEDVAVEILNESYVGKIDKKLGLMVTVKEIEEIGTGKVIMGDGAAYHDVLFTALFFKPELHEIVEGEVIEITEFGAFIRIGPMDGLVHVSQVTDDYINYDGKRGALIGKESKKSLEEGNKVRARIVALSLKGKSSKETKIGLTMRQPGLGRFEWIDEEKNKKKPTKKPTKGKK
ncbi:MULTISPECIES: DNA-directed RNA polymerase [Methanobacterium]|uniref:DNA-directed RNA polymerase subunit Rpo7 n=1 Tax=Methanobacterium spitsbergense TaxID=2874285 RepID=A0A8T5V2F2_9EURY|nr:MULTISPECIES: DNA-directed RNA polymerase [Methanobacterium]MBZ2166041.1 DNA-directed RNA polymerase [Methanobacterium spitsbergense]